MLKINLNRIFIGRRSNFLLFFNDILFILYKTLFTQGSLLVLDLILFSILFFFFSLFLVFFFLSFSFDLFENNFVFDRL